MSNYLFIRQKVHLQLNYLNPNSCSISSHFVPIGCMKVELLRVSFSGVTPVTRYSGVISPSSLKNSFGLSRRFSCSTVPSVKLTVELKASCCLKCQGPVRFREKRCEPTRGYRRPSYSTRSIIQWFRECQLPRLSRQMKGSSVQSGLS